MWTYHLLQYSMTTRTSCVRSGLTKDDGSRTSSFLPICSVAAALERCGSSDGAQSTQVSFVALIAHSAVAQVQELDGVAREPNGLVARSLVDLAAAVVGVAVDTGPLQVKRTLQTKLQPAPGEPRLDPRAHLSQNAELIGAQEDVLVSPRLIHLRTAVVDVARAAVLGRKGASTVVFSMQPDRLG